MPKEVNRIKATATVYTHRYDQEVNPESTTRLLVGSKKEANSYETGIRLQLKTKAHDLCFILYYSIPVDRFVIEPIHTRETCGQISSAEMIKNSHELLSLAKSFAKALGVTYQPVHCV